MEQEEITPELQEQMNEIHQILNTPIIEPPMALNIIIEAVQVCYEKDDIFNELDKALISKALSCFQEKVKNNETITINVN